MSQETQSKEPNPSAIWQGTWGGLFQQFNIIMTSNIRDFPNKYDTAWQIQTMLHSEIPPECQDETKPIYTETEKVMNRGFSGRNLVDRIKEKRSTIYIEKDALLKLNGEHIKSLFLNGWINKEFNTAKPRYEHKGHLG